MGNNKSTEYGKVNRFFATPIMVAFITIFAAVIGSLAGAVYQSKTSENEIVEKITEELHLRDDNKTLAATIDEIKETLASKESEIEKANEEIDDLNNKLSETDSLRSQIETEKKEKQKIEEEKKTLEEKLSEYNFITPDLSIDGNAASVDEGDFLLYNGKTFFGSSIMKHFFHDESIGFNAEDNTLSISTKDGIVPINPTLENGINLLSMETASTSPGGAIGTDATMDNSGVQHDQAVYAYLAGTRYIEYRLDKEYHWFKCNAFVTKNATDFSYDSDVWDKASITITADNGVHLWNTNSISRDAPVQESPIIDISGVKYIRITFSNSGANGGGGAILAIGDPKLFVDY